MAESKGTIGVPSMKGMGDAFKDFGIGLIGGLLFVIAVSLFGGLGVLVAPLVCGSMIKGERGTIIATLAGFALIAMGGLALGQKSTSGGASEAVM